MPEGQFECHLVNNNQSIESVFRQAYYGGEARCDVEMGENFNPEELICGGCSDIAKAQVGLKPFV